MLVGAGLGMSLGVRYVCPSAAHTAQTPYSSVPVWTTMIMSRLCNVCDVFHSHSTAIATAAGSTTENSAVKPSPPNTCYFIEAASPTDQSVKVTNHHLNKKNVTWK